MLKGQSLKIQEYSVKKCVVFFLRNFNQHDYELNKLKLVWLFFQNVVSSVNSSLSVMAMPTTDDATILWYLADSFFLSFSNRNPKNVDLLKFVKNIDSL